MSHDILEQLRTIGWYASSFVDYVLYQFGTPESIFYLVDSQRQIIKLYAVKNSSLTLITGVISDEAATLSVNASSKPLTGIIEVLEETEPFMLIPGRTNFNNVGLRVFIKFSDGTNHVIDLRDLNNQVKMEELRIFAQELKLLI